jgi:hypothetical protein
MGLGEIDSMAPKVLPLQKYTMKREKKFHPTLHAQQEAKATRAGCLHAL